MVVVNIVRNAAGGRKDQGALNESVNGSTGYNKTTRSSAIEEMLEGVTFKNGRICVKIDDAQPPFQISMQDGRGATIQSNPPRRSLWLRSIQYDMQRRSWRLLSGKLTRQLGVKSGTVLRGRSRSCMLRYKNLSIGKHWQSPPRSRNSTRTR
jgi:hypothetical protein